TGGLRQQDEEPSGGIGSVTALRIPPLDDRAAAKLVATVIGRDGTEPEELARLLVQETGGNPVHSIELLRDLLRDSVIALVGNAWTIDWARLGVRPPGGAPHRAPASSSTSSSSSATKVPSSLAVSSMPPSSCSSSS